MAANSLSSNVYDDYDFYEAMSIPDEITIKFYLQVFLPMISETVDCNYLLQRLRVLNAADRKEIFNLNKSGGNKIEATRKVLEKILEKDEPGVYRELHDVLQEDYKRIANVLSVGRIPPDHHFKERTLQLFMTEIVNRLNPRDVLPSLFAEGVIIRAEYEEIKAEIDNGRTSSAVMSLVFSIPCHIENWYERFLICLYENNSEDLAEIIDKDFIEDYKNRKVTKKGKYVAKKGKDYKNRKVTKKGKYVAKKGKDYHGDLGDVPLYSSSSSIYDPSILDIIPTSRGEPDGQSADPLVPVEILSMEDNSIQLYKKALHAGKEKVYNIRVMVVGQFGVGKTTLIKRLLGQPVDISERKSTEGIDVHKHCFKITLDKGEWIQQVGDSDQLHTLNRLIKLLPVPDQKPDISQEQEGISQVINQRENTSEIDATNSKVPSTTSVSDQEVQSSTQVSIPPLSDAKSSESEKKTKDAMMEILRLVNENADKLVKDIEKYAALSIWDFAGQFAFYTTHQMFLTSRAIYLMVIDLSQQITDDIKYDKCFLDADGIILRQVFDLFQIWMNSIHSIVKSPKDIVPVIVVGTHVDKIPEKSQKEFIDKYFKELRYMLREKPTICHLMDDIAIDNTQPDPMLEVLKRRIVKLSSQQPHWGEERPARWLPLEQAIMTLKASGTKIVPLSLIEEINMSGSVKIEDRNELELFLKFHHDIGTILHFSVEELREKIVLDPQWMIDALKSLITAETFIKKYPAVTSKLYEFIKTGKLTHELIDVIWSKENNLEFHNNKDHILHLMEQLNIIAKPRIFSKEGKETKEECYFLAPCMLHQETPEEIISPKPNSQIESSPVLCYVFIGNFLPSAIFHRLVAACIAHWPVAKKKKEHIEENLIFCGCCVFQLDEQHKLTLLFREHVIFLRVTRMGIKDKTPSSKLCIEVREFITTNLNKIIGYLGKGLEFEYSIQCPAYNGVCINCLIPVSRLKEKAEVHCEFHDHMIESCKVLDFWFEDQVKNTDCQDTDDVDSPITQEHINHARLCNALTTVCSNALREILLINVPMPHTDIYKAILANKAKLKLNKEQDQLVFPDPQGLSTGNVDEFDISLLYTIIRNVSSVPAPSNGWGKPPNDNPRDTTLGASVERIRIYRNHISGHSVDGKISQQEFEDYWAKIDEVLREIEIVIGNHVYLEDLEKRKNQAITPHEAHELQKTFQEYKKQTEAAASDILSTLEKAVSDVKKLQGNQN